MNGKKIINSITVAISVCILLCTNTSLSYGNSANSGSSLPETISGSDVAKNAVIYAGEVLVICGMVGQFTFSSSPKKDSSNSTSLLKRTIPGFQSMTNLFHSNNKPFTIISTYQFTKTGKLIQKIEQAAHRLPFEVNAIPISMTNSFVFKATKGVEVGLKIRF